MRTNAFAAAAVLVLLGAPARAEDNPACAKFEDPLAYNACLAKLGPQAGATHGVAESGAGSARSLARPRAMGAFAARGSKGRVRMEFTITPR